MTRTIAVAACHGIRFCRAGDAGSAASGFAALVLQVREACGVGFTRVNGVCVRTPARAAARRCAAGMRVVGGRCVR